MPPVAWSVEVRDHPGSSADDIAKEPDWDALRKHRIGFRDDQDRAPGITHQHDEEIERSVREPKDARSGAPTNFRDVVQNHKDFYFRASAPANRSTGWRDVLDTTEDQIKNLKDFPGDVQMWQNGEQEKDVEKQRDSQQEHQWKRLQGLITPNELHYVRNHGAVPRLDWEFHKLDIGDGALTLSMDELKSKYSSINIPVALACAGNRRKELNMIKKSKGFNWGAGAVGCAYWKGPLLRDVLFSAGFPQSLTQRGGWPRFWVNFEGADEPSQGKVVPSFVTEKDGEFAEALFHHPDTACNEQTLNSVIVKPAQGEKIALTKARSGQSYRIAGYAYDGGGHEVQRVEVSLDGGETWLCCIRQFPDYPIRHGNKFWTWLHWHVDVELSHLLCAKSITVRCFNVFKYTQPEKPSWNVLGMMNNSWYVVHPSIVDGEDSDAPSISFKHPVEPGTGKGGWMKSSVDNQLEKAKQEAGTPQKQFTRQEIEKHDREDDCWIVVDGKV
ncbi:putative nitrate reductase protein [Neofusicoccum parvum UCRNP2]|uniref:Putative nitrate reductase protein n=1 Tax=Botryosphaeria parva (strain UCR-NP2) TaxID=1287680 RepID=R1FYF1_BOTPV|nr:putative nitrate reductase protein [Neofusicoccum parvum UCRNP2]